MKIFACKAAGIIHFCPISQLCIDFSGTGITFVGILVEFHQSFLIHEVTGYIIIDFVITTTETQVMFL